MSQSAARFLVTDSVIAGIAVIAIVAFAREWLARFTERVSCHGRNITPTLISATPFTTASRALIKVGWALQL